MLCFTRLRCPSVCSVCHLWTVLSRSLRGSTWRPAGAFRIVSDTLVNIVTDRKQRSRKKEGKRGTSPVLIIRSWILLFELFLETTSFFFCTQLYDNRRIITYQLVIQQVWVGYTNIVLRVIETSKLFPTPHFRTKRRILFYSFNCLIYFVVYSGWN